ncbi:MAG: glucose 1-dehydrogenase [Polyangiaceae bacterium]
MQTTKNGKHAKGGREASKWGEVAPPGTSDALGRNESNARDPREEGPKPPFHEKHQPSPGSEAQMRVKPDHGEDSYVGHERLKGRVALITGADSGIGRAVALAYAREGAEVAIAYLNEDEDARETERLVMATGQRALLLPGDLAEPRVCEEIVEKAAAHFGHIDILVNNAAHQGKEVESFMEIDSDRIERTFRVNIMAMFNLAREVMPYMRPGGAIINTASVQAYKPSAGIIDYAATKGAVVAFTKGLAEEAIKQGIRVNCVAPGPVWTPLIAQSFEGERLENFGTQSPTKRPAQPAELAHAYVFLASNEASYVNGECLGVTGGTPTG